MLLIQYSGTYIFAGERQVGAVVVTTNRVNVTKVFDNAVEASYGSDLRHCKGLDGEEADNDGNDKSVEVVGKECSLDPADEGIQNDSNWEEEGSSNYVHSSPKEISACYLPSLNFMC